MMMGGFSKKYLTMLLMVISGFFPQGLTAAAIESDHLAQLFQKVTVPRLIPDMIDGNGVAFRDINGDNLPDIYLTCFSADNRLLLNQGAYRPFKDVTQITGLSGILRPEGVYNFESKSTIYDIKIGAVLVDSDNDEDADIFISGRGISTALYSNQTQLSFLNISERLEIYPPVEATSVIAGDVDNDRFPDFFISDEGRHSRLLHNDGDSFYSDVTDHNGLSGSGYSRSAAFSDVDLDGDLDLYICRHDRPDLFYRNNGSGNFEKVSLALPTLQNALPSSGITFADIDNDADMDLLVTNAGGPNFFYLNQTLPGDSLWIFTDISKQIFHLIPLPSYGSVIADFNNDGYQDIYITNDGPNQFFLNNGNLTFTMIADGEHTGGVKSRGVACADFDLDGDVDIIVANQNHPAQLYMNVLNNDHFIKFRLAGIRSNRDAIGAQIRIYRSGRLDERTSLLASREIQAGSGYNSQNDLVVHFGLDTIRTVDVRFDFPSGFSLTESGLKSGQHYTIYEYGLFSRAVILSAQHIYYLMQQVYFWYQVILVLIFFALIFLFVRLGSRRYKWSAGTASAYLIGFFLLALVALTTLNQLGLLYTFTIINLLTVVFVAIFFVNSERLYRLRLIRKRYRTVLIDLSNQIVNIHDNQELYETVINNIIKNTEFDKVAIAPLDQKTMKFAEPICHGFKIAIAQVNGMLNLSEFITNLAEGHHLLKQENKVFEDYFDQFESIILISVERDDRLFGLLSLGSGDTISPLTQEDIELFTSLGNQMAIAIENNDYIKRSTEMVKKLTEAEVREKYLKELEVTNKALDSKNRDLQKLYDELRSTQAQLIHSEKMASLGQLVAGISHELNNPISFIYANIRQLKTYTEKIETYTTNISKNKEDQDEKSSGNKKALSDILPDIKNLIRDTINGSQMVKNLVDNLRRFSHLDQAQWKSVDIHEGLESSLMILNPEIKHRIVVEKKYAAKRPIACNPGQINQVFLNLLSNAVQAIEGEGFIKIETSEQIDHLIIRITDSGTGIPQAIINKIFDPFFTTKDVGKGTGLGLSISYSIIKNHGGAIEVSSTPGKGSTFSVILPFNQKNSASMEG
jgi:signal transduction histidine kinase